MNEFTAESLRAIVAELFSPSIDVHRSSRSEADNMAAIGSVTDDEIDDFLFHKPLVDEETVELLTAPVLAMRIRYDADRTSPSLVAFIVGNHQQRLEQTVVFGSRAAVRWDMSHAAERDQPTVAENANSLGPSRELRGIQQHFRFAPRLRTVR